MKVPGFKALSQRRHLQVAIVGLSIAIIGGIVYFALNRGISLLQKQFQPGESVPSVQELWETGHYAQLAEVAEETLLVDPVNKNALLYAGYSYYFLAISHVVPDDITSNLDTAIRYLRLLLALGGVSNPERVQYVLGKAYLAKGFYWSDFAIKYLMLALDAGYKPEDIYEHIGRAYAILGNAEEALRWYEEASKYYSTDRLLITLGEEAFKLGHYNDAEEYYLQAIKTSRDQTIKNKGLLQLGKLYYDIGNYSKARGNLEELVNGNRNDTKSLFLLAETYFKLDLTTEARRLWHMVVRIEPDHVEALRRLYD